MRRMKILLAAALGAAVVAPGVAAVAAPTSSSTPTIKLMTTGKGKLLSTNGFVLYRFSHDKGSKDTCVKITGCSSTWPALTTTGTPNTGPGVNKALLGTTKLPNGKKQVTYAGHPIYKYAFGTKGSTSYVGVSEFGGNWYGVNAKGGAVK